MGVTGLWSLVEPAGKPIPLESLENKILAVDVSIWLNQAVKGFRDRSGNAVPNAHILGLFHRICKLLFYRIRPVFVFDGHAPQLKKETLRRRRMKASHAGKQSKLASAKILDNYIRSQAVASQLKRQSLAINKVLNRGHEGLMDALSQRNKPQEKDLFELPPLTESALDAHLSDSEGDDERERILSRFNLTDIHQLDVNSREFKKLPKDLQYEILSELKERRKQNSWNKMSEMPKKAENFSGFQMERLIKRRQMQQTLETVGKELGRENTSSFETHLFVGDLEGLRKAKAESKKIASSASGKHYLYISGLKSQQSAQVDDKFDENPDSPDSEDESFDPSEYMAQRLAQSDEVSQDEILGLIQNKKHSSQSQDSDSDSEELLEPSNKAKISNRSGGGFHKGLMVVDPNAPSTSKSFQISISKKDESESESDSSCEFVSADSPPLTATNKTEQIDEDLFSDVFKNADSHQEVENILKRAESKEIRIQSDSQSSGEFVSSVTPVVTAVNKTEQVDEDLFSDAFKHSDSHQEVENILKRAEPKPILNESESESSGGQFISDDDSSDDDNAVPAGDDDLFCDVFQSVESHKKLETILKTQTGVNDPAAVPVTISLDAIRIGVSNNEEDLFKDVFVSEAEDHYDKVKRSLDDRSKFETTEDIFAHISKTARRKFDQQPKSKPKQEGGSIRLGHTQQPSKTEENSSSDCKDEEQRNIREQIAETMKNSDHLWLKIASKWAAEDGAQKNSLPKSLQNANAAKPTSAKPEIADFEAESENLLKEMKNKISEVKIQKPHLPLVNQIAAPSRVKSHLPSSASSIVAPSSGKQLNTKANLSARTFDAEGAKLVEEMKTREKEERLLKIKNLDLKTKPRDVSDDHGDHDDEMVLSNLGVKAVDQTSYEKSVARVEGLQQSEQEVVKEDVVFASSAPGFVRAVPVHTRVVEIEPSSSFTGSSGAGFDQLYPELESAVQKLDDEQSLLTKDELIALQNTLAKEQQSLIAERSQQERIAATITDQMYSDCQELLQLFGLPWIVSPSEAEAQCAFLDMNGLSHGTITDDSDVWVFGGQKVYKNFFNQSKYCEQFNSSDLAKHFGLSREKMILLAELTGSDYTDGVESVGPVTALEILAEFPGPGIEPLEKFKSWWENHQRDYTLPPGSKLREKLVRLRLPEAFPSESVFMAYLNPSVDNSTEKFSWAVPNFVALRDFAADKFGWPWQKIDEMLKPVIKKLSTKVSQERIDNFFMSERFALPDKGNYQGSRRVKQAIEKVLGKSPVKKPTQTKVRKRKEVTPGVVEAKQIQTNVKRKKIMEENKKPKSRNASSINNDAEKEIETERDEINTENEIDKTEEKQMVEPSPEDVETKPVEDSSSTSEGSKPIEANSSNIESSKPIEANSSNIENSKPIEVNSSNSESSKPMEDDSSNTEVSVPHLTIDPTKRKLLKPKVYYEFTTKKRISKLSLKEQAMASSTTSPNYPVRVVTQNQAKPTEDNQDMELLPKAKVGKTKVKQAKAESVGTADHEDFEPLVLPPKDWRREEEVKKVAARQKAIEIFNQRKKDQDAAMALKRKLNEPKVGSGGASSSNNKSKVNEPAKIIKTIEKSKPKKVKKNTRAGRIVLPGHNLSESESD